MTGISGLDMAQLEALKRQLEEDFRMDMAAIERLQRRFVGGGHQPQAAPAPAPAPVPNKVAMIETLTPVAPKQEPAAPQPEQDELEGTLRTMFSNYRK